MVDFTLTDEQKALREMAHDFAVKEIRPVAWEYDRDSTWPQEILEKAWELGLMNSHIPSEYGGPGVSYLEGALIEEELSWGQVLSRSYSQATGRISFSEKSWASSRRSFCSSVRVKSTTVQAPFGYLVGGRLTGQSARAARTAYRVLMRARWG